MSESFLSRWARLKREAVEPEHKPAGQEAAAPAAAPERVAEQAAGDPSADETGFDPASLPPVETITAQTDIRDYLRAGVPRALSHAALRRAWATDPAISEFVGLAENAWDFNAPETIPGFGGIDPADIPRLLVQAGQALSPPGPDGAPPQSGVTGAKHPSDQAKAETAEASGPPAGEPAAPEQDAALLGAAPADEVESAADEADGAAQPDTPTPIRTHGRALPT